MKYVMEILNLLLNEYNIKAVKFTLYHTRTKATIA